MAMIQSLRCPLCGAPPDTYICAQSELIAWASRERKIHTSAAAEHALAICFPNLAPHDRHRIWDGLCLTCRQAGSPPARTAFGLPGPGRG